MSPAVTKLPGELIVPAAPTPAGKLPLSPIDKRAVFLKTMDWLQVFRYGKEPAKVIKTALAKALVPYYPAAGRVVTVEGGDIVVECGPRVGGAWSVEAAADCSLGDVKYLDGEESFKLISKDDLLPSPNKDDTIISLQVTQFSCGGFSVGFRFNHAIFDGIGASQFLKAVGDLARGLQQPAITPIWCRELVPMPPEITLQPNNPQLAQGLSPEMLANLTAYEYLEIDISAQHISHIQNAFETHTASKCSTFDVLAAKIWQCRTRAAMANADHAQGMTFIAIVTNARPLLHSVLPTTEGYDSV